MVFMKEKWDSDACSERQQHGGPSHLCGSQIRKLLIPPHCITHCITHSSHTGLCFLQLKSVKFYQNQRINCRLKVDLIAGPLKERKVFGKRLAVAIHLTARGVTSRNEKIRVGTGFLSKISFLVLGRALNYFILGLENSWSLMKPGGSKTMTEYSAQSLAEA